MRYWLYILLIICSSSYSYSQQILGNIELTGVVKDGWRPLPNTSIELYANNTLLQIFTLDISADFNIKLELNRKYQIKFVHEFYVSKFVEFNTNVEENELGYWTYSFTMELFPLVEDTDFSFLKKEPIAKINYDEYYGDFDYDHPYTNKIQRKINRLLRQYSQKRKQYYNQIITKADNAYKNNRLIQAINLYRKAEVLDRNNYYATQKLDKIDDILKKTSPEYETYQTLLLNADSLFNNHLFNDAIINYKLAQEKIDGSTYAKYMITRIDSLQPKFNSSYINLQHYREYLSNGDQYVSDANYEAAIQEYQKALAIQSGDLYIIKQIEYLKHQLAKKKVKNKKLKKYNGYIKLADKYYQNNSYGIAKLVYLKALNIFPQEKYPASQIENIDRILYPKKNTNLDEDFLDFIKKPRDYNYLKKLAKQYTKHKTVEYYEFPRKKIKRIIILKGDIASEYIEVRYAYGAFYFRNGQNISGAIFISETNQN